MNRHGEGHPGGSGEEGFSPDNRKRIDEEEGSGSGENENPRNQTEQIEFDNKLAITEKEIPGRGLLEQHPELDLSSKESLKDEHGHLHTEKIIDNDDNEIYRKNIAYVKEQLGDRSQNTDEVKSISEQIATHEKNTTTIQGTNLDKEHSWDETRTYDDDGHLTSTEGSVTEGEKKGETWNKTETVEPFGKYAKEITTTEGKKIENGQLVDFTTIETNFVDNNQKTVWGHHKHNGKQTMEWGKKPTDIK